MIFYTRSCSYLAKSVNMPQGKVIVQQFKDGELSVKVDEDVDGKEVWVCSSTVAPAENILETVFMIDALQRAGAVIKVLFVYFGYARQDRAFSGEPISVEVICRWLQQFVIQEIHVIHIHNPTACAFLSLHNHIPFDFFSHCMTGIDVVVAPDQGAAVLAQLVAAEHAKPYIVIKKSRPAKEQVEIAIIQDSVQGKNVLIVDDMISTGSTIIKVSESLHQDGAQKIIVAATHGLFSADACQRIDSSAIEKIFVTNTLPQMHMNSKISTVDIGPFIRTLFI